MLGGVQVGDCNCRLDVSNDDAAAGPERLVEYGASGEQQSLFLNFRADPFGQLPARLPPREALTAVGIPTSFKTLDDLASITAAVAYTACGEEFEGMTDQWRETVAKMVAEGKSGEAAKKS